MVFGEFHRLLLKFTEELEDGQAGLGWWHAALRFHVLKLGTEVQDKVEITSDIPRRGYFKRIEQEVAAVRQRYDPHPGGSGESVLGGPGGSPAVAPGNRPARDRHIDGTRQAPTQPSRERTKSDCCSREVCSA